MRSPATQSSHTSALEAFDLQEGPGHEAGPTAGADHLPRRRAGELTLRALGAAALLLAAPAVLAAAIGQPSGPEAAEQGLLSLGGPGAAQETVVEAPVSTCVMDTESTDEDTRYKCGDLSLVTSTKLDVTDPARTVRRVLREQVLADTSAETVTKEGSTWSAERPSGEPGSTTLAMLTYNSEEHTGLTTVVTGPTDQVQDFAARLSDAVERHTVSPDSASQGLKEDS